MKIFVNQNLNPPKKNQITKKKNKKKSQIKTPTPSKQNQKNKNKKKHNAYTVFSF